LFGIPGAWVWTGWTRSQIIEMMLETAADLEAEADKLMPRETGQLSA
jgi:hypothetical protein